MGRPQRPISDDDRSPEAEFARALRGLREDAGKPTLRVLAKRTGYSDTTLSEAMSGRGRPSLDVVLAMVAALGGDPTDWEARWRALPGSAAPATPARTAVETAEETVPEPPTVAGRRPRRFWWGMAAALLAAAAVAGAVLALGRPDEEPSVRVTLHNRVTAGAEDFREDTPAYLSTVPENFCRNRGCLAPGPDLITGDRIDVFCQTTGDRTTNGNDSDPADDANPILHTSRLWYGVRLDDGGIGYISETWLEPEDRGGLGLPRCP